MTDRPKSAENKPLTDEQRRLIYAEVVNARREGYDEVRLYFHKGKIGVVPIKKGDRSLR